MPTLFRHRPFFLLVLLLTCAATAQAEPDVAKERLEAAFILQLGRPASVNELGEWEERDLESVGGAMESVAEAYSDEDIVARANRDAFGEAGSASRGASDGSYVALLAEQVEQLERDSELYREVIGRAYQFVIQRDPYEEEFAYWEEKPAMPYILLVGCIEDWARRNQPGLMVTAGEPAVSVNCVYLSTRRLSPSVAEEARQADGLEEAEAQKSRIVVPGSEAAVSVGGVHFVACGSELMSEDS